MFAACAAVMVAAQRRAGLLHRRVERLGRLVQPRRAASRRAPAGARRRVRHPAPCGRGAAPTTPPMSSSLPSCTWRGACGAAYSGSARRRRRHVDARRRRQRSAPLARERPRPRPHLLRRRRARASRWEPVDSMPRYPFFNLRAREPGAAGARRRVRSLLDALLRRQAQLGAGAGAARGAGRSSPYLFIPRAAARSASWPTHAEDGRRAVAARARRGTSCISRATRQPHDDHLHVRIFCARNNRAFGCR